MTILENIIDSITDDMMKHPNIYKVIGSLLGISIGMLIYYLLTGMF